MENFEGNSSFFQSGLFENSLEESVINWNNIFDYKDNVPWKLTPNVFFVKSESYGEIVVAGYDVKLSKKSERVLIKEGDKIYCEVPFFRISHINIQSRGVSLSSDLIEECAKRGVIISFNSFNGKPYAVISSPHLNAVVKTRREQIKAYSDERGVVFAKNTVLGKIKNQVSLLKYFVKNSKDKEILEKIDLSVLKIKENIDKIENIFYSNIDSARREIFSYEALCGKEYWDCFKFIIPDKFGFYGREKRGAVTPVNSLLNYGYGMLYSVVWGAVMNAGLEPFAGFLHVDEPGRPSLVLDMVEEFRAPIVDRTVVSYLNRGGKVECENGLLTVSTRKEFSQKIIERFESYENYSGKKFKIKSIIQIQARNAASFFREGKEYKPFSFKW